MQGASPFGIIEAIWAGVAVRRWRIRKRVYEHTRSMITVEAKKVATRVIATVKVGIRTGQFTYAVQFADQGSETANEAEAQRGLRKILEEVLEALGPS